MKTRTAILVICLAATSVSIGKAQTAIDNAGNRYTCRTPDVNKIYSKVGALHKYNIAKAKDLGEHHPANHNAICIDLLNNDTIDWSWPGADDVKVSFFPMTNDSMGSGRCWNSTNPFPKMKGSGTSDTVHSGQADENSQFCAYKLQFESSLGSYDPHIIINGSNIGLLVDALKEERKALNDLIVDLEKKKK